MMAESHAALLQHGGGEEKPEQGSSSSSSSSAEAPMHKVVKEKLIDIDTAILEIVDLTLKTKPKLLSLADNERRSTLHLACASGSLRVVQKC